MTDKKKVGDEYYQKGDYRAAIYAYSSAIEVLGNNRNEVQLLSKIYSNRCACYLRLERVNDALFDAEKCVQLQPKWSKAYNRLGSVRESQKKFDLAIASYQQALALDRTNVEAANALNKLLSSRQTGDNSSSSNSSSSSRSNGTSIFASLQTRLQCLLTDCFIWWNNFSPENKNYVYLAFFAIIVYYFFFSGSGRHYYDYDYGYSDYGGGGPMSWTTWSLIMAAAWKLPPMFPDIFGEYARPFFGLNWTTFMYLLNMFSNNRGMASRGFGGSSMFGNRRRCY